jgi:hypothetical protein
MDGDLTMGSSSEIVRRVLIIDDDIDFAEQADAGGLAIIITIADDLRYIRADARVFTQIQLNLISKLARPHNPKVAFRMARGSDEQPPVAVSC